MTLAKRSLFFVSKAMLPGTHYLNPTQTVEWQDSENRARMPSAPWSFMVSGWLAAQRHPPLDTARCATETGLHNISISPFAFLGPFWNLTDDLAF